MEPSIVCAVTVPVTVTASVGDQSAGGGCREYGVRFEVEEPTNTAKLQKQVLLGRLFGFL
jgi:hypothetical protein